MPRRPETGRGDPVIEMALWTGAVALMALLLLLVPLGLPGTWLMVGVLVVGLVAGRVAWTTLLVLVALVALAEVAEFLLVRHSSLRYGGSSRAFWGAVAGGLIGVVVGVPVPVVGSLVAGVGGTFLGAGLVAMWEERHVASAARVGWGAVVGRALSAAVKIGAGLVVLVVGGAALLAG